MAKITKSQSAPSTPSTPDPNALTAGAVPPAGNPNDVFTRVFDEDDKPSAPKAASKKLAPQAQLIVNTVEAAYPSGLTRAELISKLTGVIVTRQPVGRIVTYYQKLLTEGTGLLTITKQGASVV